MKGLWLIPARLFFFFHHLYSDRIPDIHICHGTYSNDDKLTILDVSWDMHVKRNNQKIYMSRWAFRSKRKWCIDHGRGCIKPIGGIACMALNTTFANLHVLLRCLPLLKRQRGQDRPLPIRLDLASTVLPYHWELRQFVTEHRQTELPSHIQM